MLVGYLRDAMTGEFFDYPSGEADPSAGDVTFLGDHFEEDWSTILDHTETRRFTAGEVVIRAGDTDRALYLVTRGNLAVAGRGAERFRAVEAPAVIGEVAFLDGGPRSVTLVATTDGELRRMSMPSFEALAGRHPALAREILFNLGRIVSRRLRYLTQVIEDGVG
jgi:CRP/FNR family transcriptional regulator, cyclic AMP receptor protein